MSFVHGKNARVYVGAVDLSPYLNSADFSMDVDVADTTTFGAGWKTAIPGTSGSTLAVTGLYDPDVVTLSTLMQSLVPGALTYAPGGAAAVGDPVRLVSAIDTSYAESSPVGGVVAVSASFLGDGVAGMGRIVHPLSEDTNTTTGTGIDNNGLTSATGWTAHLHVLAVDGGSWVVTIEDDTTGAFTGTPATIATFAAATGATSQRLQSATATDFVRRYTRYIATRTGGSAGDGITFALALARNR